MTGITSDSIPFGNRTALHHDQFSGWMTGANTRGTMDILISCVTTIILCVYTAIHLNVPRPGEDSAKQYLRKAKWVAIAILAPEIVVASAWYQMIEARQVRNELRNVHRSQTSGAHADDGGTKIESRPELSTLNLSYGFFFVMGGMRMRRKDDERDVSHLATPDLLIHLAKSDVWWDIHPGMIQDRSKADSLAKCLVFFQVSWMLAQCIARVASHLPLTLLELHTFVHVVCALVMFVLWFKKPLNVQEPVIITIDDDNCNCPDTCNFLENLSGPYERATNTNIDLLEALLALSPQSALVSTWRNISSIALNWYYSPTNRSLPTHRRRQVFATIVGFLQAIYGGLHLVAWDFNFPSRVEALLWKISSFLCVLIVNIWIVTVPLPLSNWVLEAVFKSKLPTEADDALNALGTVCILVMVLGFFLGRGFIVVESLISLRNVPIGVYAAIPWANYIPHL